MKKLVTLLGFGALCLLVMAAGARAQGVGSSGDIKGTITDASGGVLPKVSVAAVETAKGFRRTVVTDDSGEYRVTGLAPGTYDVSAELHGFETAVRKGLAVTVGQTVIADFQLKVSQASITVEVTGETPVVETEKSKQADTIEEKYIRDLPINRRDYLTYTLLVPGVTNSTTLAGDQDFRVKQTPQSGLSFYGSNGRGNSVTVDGGEYNDDSGSVRPNLSQDAVLEFQINRSNYSADLGGAGGASINIVSKSGSNQVHGSLYGFFRNDALDAQDPFAFSQALAPKAIFDPTKPDSLGAPVKNTLSRQQFGGALGFPIKKGKTFLFAAFEGLRQDAQNAVPILTNTNIFRPTAAQATLLSALGASGAATVPCFAPPAAPIPPAICAGILTNALTISQNAVPIPGLVDPALDTFAINQLEANGGLFSYNTRQYQTSGRLDHQFSDRNQIFLRYSFVHDVEENPDVQSLTGFSRGSSIRQYDNTLQGSWFHLFSPSTTNEARVQFAYTKFNVIPNEPAEIGLDVPGFANLGTNIFLPNLTIERRWEFADNFTKILGHHTIKFGGSELLRGNHTETHTFFPGRFVFASLPGGLVSPCLAGPIPANAPTNPCGLVTAGVSINPLQNLALGLPEIWQQGFGTATYAYTRPFTAAYVQDSWTILPNLTLNYGLRYEVDAQYAPLNTGKKNFAPRVSFAWDPFKDHKTVVRGGYGIFYTPVYAVIPYVVHYLGNLNNGTNRPVAIYLVPIAGIPGFSSAAIYKTLFATQKVQCTIPTPPAVACVTPADVNPLLPVPVSNTGALQPLAVIFHGQPDFASPYSQQGEFGIEREIVPGLSVSASYIYVHTLRLPVAIDTNLLPAPIVTLPLANGKLVSYRDWNTNPVADPIFGAPCKGAAIFTCFVNPLIVQNNQYSSKASALYQGGILEIKERFRNYFTLLASYTYSKAIDESTDYNSDYGPQDNTSLGSERGLSNFDQRHKVVIAAVIDSPSKGGQGASMAARIFSGFQVSPIFTYNSPHPFNLLAGVDVNGDNHPTNDRPIGAARNTGIGPNYMSFDMRLSRRFKLTEKASLQLLAEGFNLANRTNFASINNVVSPIFGLTPGFTTFRVHGNSALSPTTPLGFTSAFPKRQIQFGLRLAF